MRKKLRIIRMIGRLSVFSFVFATLLFNTLFAAKVSSQSAKSVREACITVCIENKMLFEALKLIERNSDYHFVYMEGEPVANNKVLISAQIVDQTIETLLLEISRQSNVSFRQLNDLISVRSATRSEQTKKVQIHIGKQASGTVRGENGEPRRERRLL